MSNYKPAPVSITGITLLSIQEVRAAEDYIPPVDGYWWLRSPGLYSFCVAYASSDSHVYVEGFGAEDDSVGVRPALLFNPESANLVLRDKVNIGGFVWTHIAEGILLCDEIIDQRPFRKEVSASDVKEYEASDVKKYLDKMFANIMAWKTVRDALGEMSYAFHTLHDHMKDHMPDYGCGNDAYALEVEESVANAYADFTRNEQKLKALIESL